MGSDRVFSQVPLVALGWLCVMLPWVWPSRCRPGGARPAPPLQALRKRSHAPNPFAGLTHQPHCAACEHTPAPSPPPLQPPPPPRAHAGAPTPGRPLAPGLPQPGRCVSGRGGLGASPRHWAAQWRPLAAAAGRRLAPLFSRDPGPALAWPPPGGRAQRARPRVCLAAGRGLRGTARGFAVEPHPGRPWSVEAAEPLQAFSPTSCTTYRSGRCNSLRGVRCAARSRTARAMRPRRLHGWRVRPRGSGWRWPRSVSGYCPGPWASAPWRWRHVWSPTSRRSWPPTVPRGC